MDDVSAAIAKLEERISGALRRLDEAAKRDELLHEINNKLDVLKAHTEGWRVRIEEEVSTLKKRVSLHGEEIDELQQKPAKRWESLVGYLISAIVGAIIVFVATKIGLK